MTLGRVGALSLEKAREKALAHRQAAKDGADPLQAERARRELPTVADALDRFEAEYIPRRMEKGRMAERTASEYRRQIARNLRPALGGKRVRDVTQDDIERMLRNPPPDTRKRNRGKLKPGEPMGPVAGNRILALTSKVFRCCEDWGWRQQNSNPARGIEKAVEEPRDRTLSSDELSALGSALSAIDANEAGNPGHPSRGSDRPSHRRNPNDAMGRYRHERWVSDLAQNQDRATRPHTPKRRARTAGRRQTDRAFRHCW